MNLETVRFLLWAGVALGAILAATCGFFVNVVGQKIAAREAQTAALTRAAQEKQRAPARDAVFAELATLYASVAYAASGIVISPEGHFTTDRPSPSNYQASRVLLARADEVARRLGELLKLNNAALDASLLPKLTTTLQGSEKLIALLKFFAEFQNPTWERYDFVSENPVARIKQFAAVIDELRTIYPETFVVGRDLPSNLLSPAELESLWQSLERNCRRISYTPADYAWHDKTPVAVFNPANLRALRVPPPAQEKNGVYMFFGYQ